MSTLARVRGIGGRALRPVGMNPIRVASLRHPLAAADGRLLQADGLFE